LCHWIFSLT